MRELTSFDHLALVEEMKNLVGRHFQKMSLIEGGYKLRFRGADVLILFPDKVYPTSYSVPSSTPDNFSLKVRKHLKGLRLQDIRILNLDRVMVFDFGSYSLVLELFREGNVLLLEEGKVLSVLRPGSWSHRELRVGVMYKTPPPPPISREEFLTDSILLRDLIRSGVPKPYAREIVHRLDVDEKTPTSQVDTSSVLSTLKELLDELRSPSGYLCDNEPFPVELSYVENCEKRFPSFSELLDSYTPSLLATEHPGEKNRPSKLDYMLSSLEDLNREISDLEQLINYVYENWGEVEKALKAGNFEALGKLRVKGRKGKLLELDFTP